jgi:hypothetical protein
VFCGFRGVKGSSGGRRAATSEKDFVYMLLEIFATGKLRKRSTEPGAGEDITSNSPVFSIFEMVRELGEGSPATEAAKLVQNCDFALVILPYRKTKGEDFDTSVYALMEYAYACGSGLPVILIAEDRVDSTHLGFATELHRWPSNIDRVSIQKQNKWESLHRDFKGLVEELRLKKPFVVGLPACKVDDFYREKLIPIILDWHEVKIYNHSILPLSSSYSPARGLDAWEDFGDIQKFPLHQPHRGLYFEVEEALLTGSRTRMDRFIKFAGRKHFHDSCLTRINKRFQRRLGAVPFRLVRFASLIPFEAYRAFSSNEDKKRGIARNLSILLQLFRLQQTKARGALINYDLFGFKTFYPYSMPTTIHAEQGPLNHNPSKTCGVWGILRSSGSLEPGESDDAFILGRNSDCVAVWAKHIDAVNMAKGGDKPIELFVSGSGAQFDNFFRIVGPRMRELLRAEAAQKAWKNVLDITGI